MSLSSLIRKDHPGRLLLLFLLFLLQMRGTASKVAGIATIAVASTTNEKQNRQTNFPGGRITPPRPSGSALVTVQKTFTRLQRHPQRHLTDCRDSRYREHSIATRPSAPAAIRHAYLTESSRLSIQHGDFCGHGHSGHDPGITGSFTAVSDVPAYQREETGQNGLHAGLRYRRPTDRTGVRESLHRLQFTAFRDPGSI